jgi:hypothetical protein
MEESTLDVAGDCPRPSYDPAVIDCRKTEESRHGHHSTHSLINGRESIGCEHEDRARSLIERLSSRLRSREPYKIFFVSLSLKLAGRKQRR